MGTIVTIEVVAGGPDAERDTGHDTRVERAFGWFGEVERVCSRFDPESELMRLSRQPVGAATTASPLLFDTLRFALAVAHDTDGAFDPTIGRRMETRGFNREHRSGRTVSTPIGSSGVVTFRDVLIDDSQRTVTLLRPMVLDLGAVAKGLAIDLAARELEPLGSFAIDAGGDLYLAGRNPRGGPWSVGIRHPRLDDELLESLSVSGRAVCTSGNYEAVGETGVGIPHVFDPRGDGPAHDVVSATVVASSAMLADALATAAFVLGPVDGVRLLERHGVDGLVVSHSLEHSRPRSSGDTHRHAHHP